MLDILRASPRGEPADVSPGRDVHRRARRTQFNDPRGEGHLEHVWGRFREFHAGGCRRWMSSTRSSTRGTRRRRSIDLCPMPPLMVDPEAVFQEAEELWARARPDKARESYELAAQTGHAQAAFQLGWLILNEDDESRGRSEVVATGGIGAAPRGCLPARRSPVDKKERPTTPKSSSNKRRTKGTATRRYQLGWLELNERDNESEAIEWWQKGAEQQDSDAAFQLAEHLVENEPDTAKQWYTECRPVGAG